MPARAFVDSDKLWFTVKRDRGDASKCPQGHLLILINEVLPHFGNPPGESKCPQGHLLILIEQRRQRRSQRRSV